MSAIKVYADEQAPIAVAQGLRRRGIDVLTTPEAGLLGAADEEQLAFAVRQGRVIFTQDDDFLRLHARGKPHLGIIYVHQQTPVGEMIRSLMLVCQVLDAEEMLNHVEFL